LVWEDRSFHPLRRRNLKSRFVFVVYIQHKIPKISEESLTRHSRELITRVKFGNVKTEVL
jgi:hypothetical protein